MSEEQQKSDQSADLERVWGLLEEYRIAALDTQEAYEWSINNGGNNDAEREAESIQLIALRAAITALVRRAVDEPLPLPRPSMHAAAHYAAFLRRESFKASEPTKAGAIRNSALMIELLYNETRRLHQELIDASTGDSNG